MVWFIPHLGDRTFSYTHIHPTFISHTQFRIIILPFFYVVGYFSQLPMYKEYPNRQRWHNKRDKIAYFNCPRGHYILAAIPRLVTRSLQDCPARSLINTVATSEEATCAVAPEASENRRRFGWRFCRASAEGEGATRSPVKQSKKQHYVGVSESNVDITLYHSQFGNCLKLKPDSALTLNG